MCGKKAESSESIYQRIKGDTPLTPLANLGTDTSKYAPSRTQSLRNVENIMGGRARSLLMPYSSS